MANARFFKAITSSSDPFPNLSKDAVRRLQMPVLIVRGAATDELHRMVTEELARLPFPGKTCQSAEARRKRFRHRLDTGRNAARSGSGLPELADGLAVAVKYKLQTSARTNVAVGIQAACVLRSS
jgi:hypothetical protein